MSAATQREHFPSDETLAAFVEGRLDEATRKRVTDHMVTCDECYSVFLAAADAAARDEPAPGVVLRGRWTRAVAIVAAAAAIAGVLFLSPLRDRILPGRSPMGEIAAAVPAHRIFAGRLSAIPFRPFEEPDRSGETERHDPLQDPGTLQLTGAAAKVVTEVNRKPTADNLHALGVSYLLLGRWNAAVETLERAVQVETGVTSLPKAIAASKSAALLTDLAAAYSARGHELRQSLDAAAALDCASRAVRLARTPATTWNLAIALEDVHLRAKAQKAWADFLAISDSPEASAEARRRLAEASKTTTSEEWQRVLPRLLSAAAASDAATVDALAARYPQQVRTYVEQTLLPKWGDAIVRGATAEAATQLAACRVIAHALAADAMLADSVAAIERGSADARVLLARGHQRYGAAQATHQSDAPAETARDAFAEARDLLARGGSPFAMNAALYVASCEFRLRNYDRAFAMTADIERQIADRPSYRVLAGLTRWTRGVTLISLGDVNEALDEYHAAVDAFARAGEIEHVVDIQGVLATTYDTLGDDERSWTYRVGALQQLDAYGNAAGRAPQILDSSARAALRASMPFAAMHFLDAELLEALRRHWDDYAVDALLGRSDAEAAVGDRSAAVRDAAAAHARASQIRDERLRRGVVAQPDFIRVALRTLNEPADRIATVERATRDAAATGDSLRGAELLALLGRECLSANRFSDAEAALSSAALEVERQRPSLSDRVLADAYADTRRGIYDSLADLALRRGDARAALDIVERSRELAVSAKDAPPVVAAIPDGVTAVVFAVRDDALLLWSIRDGAVRFTRVAIARDDLERRTAELRMRTRDAAAFTAASLRLSSSLVAPWIESARGSRIVVFAVDDATAAVPFAALSDAARGQLLIEEFAIVSVPSLDVFRRSSAVDAALRRRNPQPQPLRVAVTGAGVADERNRALDVGPEIESVADAYRGADVLRDDTVTDARLLAAAARSDVVHFAGHAVVDGRNPLDSALLVAPAGGKRCLYAHEIAACHFDRPRVVVLSACGSARRGDRRNGSVGSLSGAFIAAGVPSVVGTLWNVRDGESASLIRKLHEEIRSGRDAANALRAAQLEVMHTQPPAVWAAFQVVGGVS